MRSSPNADRRLSTLFAYGCRASAGIEQGAAQLLTVQICVASNSSVDPLGRKACGRTRWPRFLVRILTAPAHVARSKPAPDLALHCLAQIVPRGSVIFVDDQYHASAVRGLPDLCLVLVGPQTTAPIMPKPLRACRCRHRESTGAKTYIALLTRPDNALRTQITLRIIPTLFSPLFIQGNIPWNDLPLLGAAMPTATLEDPSGFIPFRKIAIWRFRISAMPNLTEGDWEAGR